MVVATTAVVTAVLIPPAAPAIAAAGSQATGAAAGATATAATATAATATGTVTDWQCYQIHLFTGGAAAGTGATALGVLSGPIGWAILGADEDGLTWDCWKKVDIKLQMIPFCLT